MRSVTRGARIAARATAAALLACLMSMPFAGPARAGALCETAEMLVAIEIAAQELAWTAPEDADAVIGRISSSLEFTNWLTGVEALPEEARRSASEAIDKFVASRRAMVAAYKEEGLNAARVVMQGPDYLPHSRIIDLVEQLADCSPPVTVESVREGKAQYMLHGTLAPSPSSIPGEPSIKLLWSNLLFVVAALIIGQYLEILRARRAKRRPISYETVLRDGPATLSVTVIAITRREARMVVPEELEPGSTVEVSLHEDWYDGAVVFSTHTFAMVTFDQPLPRRVVRSTRRVPAVEDASPA